MTRRADREAAFAEFRSPHERRQPSRSFVAVLCVLGRLGRGYMSEVAERAGVAPDGAVHVLRRMYRLHLVDKEREVGDPHELGRPLRTYYTLTKYGRELATKLCEEEGSEA